MMMFQLFKPIKEGGKNAKMFYGSLSENQSALLPSANEVHLVACDILPKFQYLVVATIY